MIKRLIAPALEQADIGDLLYSKNGLKPLVIM